MLPWDACYFRRLRAFLACLPGRQVLGVDTRRIALVTRTSARLSAYCPEDGGVLAWELYSSAGKPSGRAPEGIL
jgi:hypothetical protein